MKNEKTDNNISDKILTGAIIIGTGMMIAGLVKHFIWSDNKPENKPVEKEGKVKVEVKEEKPIKYAIPANE